ncbi:MAG: hypothetical protein LBR16_02225 [Treponema sp.]|jgi:YbbR domain-containing protein|nr:hypothetical protein [Treponema sp.]
MRLLSPRALLARAVYNWPAKVLCTALALFLFVFHKLNTQQTRVFSVPLRIVQNETLNLSDDYQKTIRINLQGSSEDIIAIEEADIDVYLDLTRLDKPGRYRVPLRMNRYGNALEGNVRIDMDPQDIMLTLEMPPAPPAPEEPAPEAAASEAVPDEALR